MSVSLSMKVNGKTVSAQVDERTLLVDFLRTNLALTGTHVGCDTAQCGACTVHVDGRAVKTTGHNKAITAWNVLICDHHEGYIDWARFEENQRMLLENAHMKRRAARKSGRGGRALLTGLVRCGRCGRMMRVFYGMRSGHAHRYQCRGDDAHVGSGLCIGIGGIRVEIGDDVIDGTVLSRLDDARRKLAG